MQERISTPPVFQPYKERELKPNHVVDVYRNLHTTGFSIRCAKTKRVLGHCEAVTLIDCTFFVSEKSRQRVLKNNRRNVHAYVRGTLVAFGALSADSLRHPIYYNPFKVDQFIECSNQIPIYSAEAIHFYNRFCFLLDK